MSVRVCRVCCILSACVWLPVSACQSVSLCASLTSQSRLSYPSESLTRSDVFCSSTGKCDFAHSALELRVKENRRGRWGGKGPGVDPMSDVYLRESGGEDVLGSARSIEKVRAAEGSVSEFERSSSTMKKTKGGGGGGGGGGLSVPLSPSPYLGEGHGLQSPHGQPAHAQQYQYQQRRPMHYQYPDMKGQQYYYQPTPAINYPLPPSVAAPVPPVPPPPFSTGAADFPSLYRAKDTPPTAAAAATATKL